MKVWAAVAMAASAMTAFAEATWTNEDGAASASGGGTVTVPADTEATSLTVTADPAITLDGVGIAFTGETARVSQMGLGAVTCNVPITATGPLSFAYGSASAGITYDDTQLYKSKKVQAFSGIDISDYVIVDAVTFGGGSIVAGNHYKPYHVARGEGWSSAQLQIVDGGWAKCVKVMLEQNGENVDARIVYAKYLTPDRIGADFDEEGTGTSVSESSGAYGYGVKGITIHYSPSIRATQAYRQPVQAGGLLSFGTGIEYVFTGDAALSADGSYAGDLFVDSVLSFKNRRTGSWNLSGNISGTAVGVLRFASWDAPAEFVPGDTVSVRGAAKNGDHDYFSTAWQDVVQGVSYLAVSGIVATMHGPSILPTYTNAHVEFVSNGTDRAYYQAQITDDTWYKCVDIELRNDANGTLQVRGVQALYCKANQVSPPYVLPSLEEAQSKGGGSVWLGSYCVNQLDITYDTFERPAVPQYAVLTGTNDMEKGTIEVSGSETSRSYVSISGKNALPPNGSLIVRNGGTVTLNAPGLEQDVGYRSGSCQMFVYPGGELRGTVDSVFRYGVQVVNVEGGTVTLESSHSVDAKTYLSRLNISNGGLVRGKSPRVGYNATSKWRSSGTGTNVVDSGIIMTGPNGGSEVAWDVTCDADLMVNGKLTTYGRVWGGNAASYTNCVLVKMGPAKFIQNGDSYVLARVRVKEGTYVLGKSDSVGSGKRFELSGATLELADGVTQSLDVLPLGTNAVATTCGVVLGEGAQLSLGAIDFGDAGVKLSVTGPNVRDGQKTGLRVGTTACLDAVALRRLKYNDYAVTQDAEGWIRAGSHGTMMIFR